jgi:Rab-GTPase-TBC domain
MASNTLLPSSSLNHHLTFSHSLLSSQKPTHHSLITPPSLSSSLPSTPRTTKKKNAPSRLETHADLDTISHRHSLPLDKPRLRSLILPMLRTIPSATRSTSPGSPPDLTDSKSSKSSSYPSLSLADSAPTDLSHFEDISLDDVSAITSPWSEKSVLSGTTVRANPSSLYRLANENTRSLRDLTNASRSMSGGRPRSATAMNKFQLPVPAHRTKRPRIRPLAMNQSRTQEDSSPLGSPTAAQRPFVRSARSATGSCSSGPTRFSSASLHVRRRQSWQTGRKSVKELEEEYHDSDDELPDDAVIWNVPISPRPPHEREFRRAETEPALLPSSLPAGQQGQPNSSANGPVLDRADTNMSSSSAPAAISTEPSNHSNTPESPVLSDTSSAEYPNPHTLSLREAALSNLCSEARELTDALERFAETSERAQEARIQSGQARPSSSSASSPTSTTPTLPPMRRNDPLIDPLPVSKTKEKFLTRTRPSWLPPKNQKEEKRHLKEYQKMMAAAAEAEKKRARRQQKVVCERDTAALDRARTWEEQVLPNWRTAVREPKTRELWWAGIPPQNRADVWSHAVGNELGLNTASYEAALKRARETDERLATLSEDERERDTMGALFAKITASASTVYSDLRIFAPDGPMHQSLLDICKAYAVYRVDASPNALANIPSLAALLLLNLPAAPAFITLANALNRPLPSAILTNEPATLHTSYNLILTTLSQTLPSLHAHLTSLSNRSSASSTGTRSSSDSLTPTSPLITDLLHPLLEALIFASPRLSIDIATRLWDIFAFEADVAVVRAAVAVLACLEGRLYGGRLDEVCREVDSCGEGWWPLGGVDGFVARMREVE